MSEWDFELSPAVFDEPTRETLRKLQKRPVDKYGERIGQKHYVGIPRVQRARDPENCRYPENLRSETDECGLR